MAIMPFRFTPIESGLIAACVAIALVAATPRIEAAIAFLSG